MKKLFYTLFLVPIFFCSCSDDDDFFTKDIDYTVSFHFIESYETSQCKVFACLERGDWYIEGYSCSAKITHIETANTLHIHLGDMEYTKHTGEPYPGICASTRLSIYPGYQWEADFSYDISQIVITKKGVQDIYNIEVTDTQLIITPQQSAFSKFASTEYLIRPQNTFGVVFTHNDGKDLYDDFFKFATTTIPLSIYNYKRDDQILWYMMMRSDAQFYRYENPGDYKQIIRLFEDFCDEASKEQSPFYAQFEDWTGKKKMYPHDF